VGVVETTGTGTTESSTTGVETDKRVQGTTTTTTTKDPTIQATTTTTIRDTEGRNGAVVGNNEVGGALTRGRGVGQGIIRPAAEILGLPVELWTTSSKMRGVIFPTMTETDWIDLEDNPKSECLLNTTTPVIANPFASILVDDNDDWGTTDFSYLA
jgi:hypothetical protein